MICPSNRKSEVTFLQWSHFNPSQEDGMDTNYEQMQKTMSTMMECPQNGCGAWQNERCCYAAQLVEKLFLGFAMNMIIGL